MGMKVIIADDEIYIGSLVKYLIDWEGLNLTLAGVFRNGMDVLKQMEKEPADIVICDIEMPGISGIELIERISQKYPFCQCIVISGFRNFDYAHSAMRYGVTNYLLKPIDGEELNQALKAVIAEKKKEEQSETYADRRTDRLRLADIFSAHSQERNLDEINRKYGYSFREGTFNIFKIIFTGGKAEGEAFPYLMKLLENFVKPKLTELCYEAEAFRASERSNYFLVNYKENREVRSLFDDIFRGALMEMGAKAECGCYIGVGIPVNDLRDINTSYHSAQFAVSGRMRGDGRRIFYADFCDYDRLSKNTVNVSLEEKHNFQSILEQIDEKSIRGWVDRCFETRKKEFSENPYLIIAFSNKIIELTLAGFEELGVPIPDRISFRKSAAVIFDSSDTEKRLREKLTAIIAGEMKGRLSVKRKNDMPYVQYTKNYIEKNYANAVSLELIAEELHINSVYLSTLFKNETGVNYSKYLAAVRVEKSKELLRSYDMNLTQIANAVGYDSVQYFNSLFKKLTGLKPSEYRRIHQHEK